MIELIALLPDGVSFEAVRIWATEDGVVTAWLILGAILALTGIGFPSPEDIPLMVLGYLIWESGFFGMNEVGGFSFTAFLFATLYCASCNVMGDVVCFAAGRRWGLSIRNRVGILRRLLNDERLAKVEGWYTRFGTATVFVGRMVAGLRLVTFFFAGTMRMPYRKFIFWDYIGCFISIPIWLSIGAAINEHEEWIMDKLGQFKIGVIIFGVLLLGGFIIYVKYFAKRKPGKTIEEELRETGETELLEKLHYDVNYQRVLSDEELAAARAQHEKDKATSARMSSVKLTNDELDAAPSQRADAPAEER